MAAKKASKKTNRKTAPKRPTSAQSTNVCLCGCGETCGAGRYFKQGHDARMKGYLLKIARGETKGMSGGQVRRIKGLVAKKHEALQSDFFQRAING